MSHLDPFGPAPTSHIKARNKNAGDTGSFLGLLDETVRDVGSQMTKKGMRGWAGVSGIMGACDAFFGAVFLLCAFKIPKSDLVESSIIVGAGLILLGLLSVLSLKKHVPSIMTLHLTLAAVMGMLSASFMNQVAYTSQNDCTLAEASMRLSHLEEAMHAVRHEELIHGIMTRLDNLHTDIDHLREHTEDKFEEHRMRSLYKEMDANYVEHKLQELKRLAEDGLADIDERVRHLEANITATENLAYEHEENLPHLRSELRYMKHQQKILGPRKQALQDAIIRLERHIHSGVSTDEYVEILNLLEKHITGEHLQQEIKDQHTHVEYVRESADRRTSNEYDTMVVGHYFERAANRTTARHKKREEFEKLMASLYKTHDNKLGDREQYLTSLNDWLESMPEHCMSELDWQYPLQWLGLATVALTVANVYVGLNRTYVSGKDY